ncbi:MAG: hypothetical protein JWP30_306 [Homoserinimonas sp.]|nr:hypothetical protein [Homoserinimonas sp.]
MIVRRIVSNLAQQAALADAEGIDIDAPEAQEELTDLYKFGRGAWLRINLVATVSGSVVGADGTSHHLSSRADRRILGAIRSLGDVVLVGAASVRVEGYRLPKSARLAIVTFSGDLSGHGIQSDVAPGRIMVICPPNAASSVRLSLGSLAAEIITIEDADGRIEARAIVAALHERKLTSIVCEGGPNLAAQLLEEDLVDELCLTTSPLINGGLMPPFGHRALAQHHLRLVQLLIDDSHFLYARWQVVGREATS